MCPVIRAFTMIMLLLPLALAVGAAAGPRPLFGPALLLLLIYGWVWTRFRPTRFVVRPDAVEVIWPLKRRELPRESNLRGCTSHGSMDLSGSSGARSGPG